MIRKKKLAFHPAMSQLTRNRLLGVAYRLAVGGMLIGHALLVLALISRYSATYNEPGHISSGLACWHDSNFELYRVNPPLAKMLTTIPLLTEASVSLEMLARATQQEGKRSEVAIGRFFAETNALQFNEILCRSRLMGLIWITVGGVLVWHWGCKLFGAGSGLLSLALWTFEPTVTAHAALATPDIPATVLAIAASYSIYRLSLTGGWKQTVYAGITIGLAILCKFTLILVWPAFALTWLALRRHDRTCVFCGLRAGQQMRRVSVLVIVAWVVLCAGYRFTGVGMPIGSLQFFCSAFEPLERLTSSDWLSSLPCPVPAAFLTGIDMQQRDFEGNMMSYLRGEWRYGGWWYYYIYAFGIKSPIGHLVIYCLTIPIIVRSVPRHTAVIAIFPILLLAIASMKTGMTNHVRYILPAYPFIMILSGALVSKQLGIWLSWRRGIVSACLLCSAISMSCADKNYIGYFNEAVGGYRNGWLLLATSNVDWGQDWILLRDWLEKETDRKPIHLSLINHIDYRVYLMRQYPLPEPQMSGYAVVDTQSLTRDFRWLQDYPLVARIGSSIFVFEVRN